MKPIPGWDKQPAVEYYYVRDSLDLRGKRPNKSPARTVDVGYSLMKREASRAFIREAILFIFIAIGVLFGFICAGRALVDFLNAIAV